MPRARTHCRIMMAKGRGCYQAVNLSPSARRLPENHLFSGPFYWPSPRAAWRAVKVILEDDAVDQALVETIGGRRVGCMHRDGTAYALSRDD